MQRLIGIDFGTSTTYMNIKRYNGNQPIEDRFSYLPVVFNYGESSGFVASIVRENADGSFDFGEKAEEQLVGAKIYKEIKMSLESSDEQKRSEARRITKEFFRYLYETYTQQAANFGSADDVEETIVSYPVKWQPETSRFMIDAAQEAGFRNVKGMDEASAAVMAVLCQNANSKLISAGSSGYLMMIDMGAGTTDLVICKYQSDESNEIRVELVSSWPVSTDEPSFGGREIDGVLEKYVEDYLAKALNPALAPQAHVIASAPGQAKMWKERNVSASLAANKQVNTCAYIGTYKMMGMLNGEFTPFGKVEFEKMAESCLADYVRLIMGCLTSTGLKDPEFASDGLDLVILTGGHSAWYFAREIIDGTMAGYMDHPALSRIRMNKDRVVNLSNPQTTVSLGLVYSKLPYRLTKDVPVGENIHKESSTDVGKTPTPEGKSDRVGEVRTASTENTYYKWDNVLIPEARRFIEENGAEVKSYLREGKDPQMLLVRRLGISGNTEVFMLHDDSICQRAEECFAVTAIGFHTRRTNRYRVYVSWEEFLNTGIRISPHDFGGLCLTTPRPTIKSTKEIAIISSLNDKQQRKAMEFFLLLQEYLRKRSCELLGIGEADKSLQPEIQGKEKNEIPDLKAAPNKEEEHSSQSRQITAAKSASAQTVYDSSKCPKCGADIPEKAKKCPTCGRIRLRELKFPYKLGGISWFYGDKGLGIAKAASGTLTIHEDRIEYKKHLGNAMGAVVPIYNVYATIKANVDPKEIFWIRDIAAVKERTYGLGLPAIVITMRGGTAYTFVAPRKSVNDEDRIKGAIALISRLIGG